MSDQDDKRNYLRVRAANFSLELEGDPDFILETYDNVRRDVLRRLIELMGKGHVAPVPSAVRKEFRAPASRMPMANRRGMPAPPPQRSGAPGRPRQQAPKTSKGQAQHYVWVYVTHEIYNKVYVVDSPTFLASPLSRFLDGVRLRKIYLDRTHQEVLRPLVGTGKTLWSELTKKGREQLANTGK